MSSINYPKDWEIQSFSHIADFINGAAFKPTDWKTEGLPIIRIQNLNNPDTEFNYFDGKLDERYYVKNGDILLSWSASLGVYRWDRGNAILNQHIFNVKPKGGINKDFLFYISHKAIDDLSRKVHGSTMKHFKKRELDEAKVPVPPLVEQRGIVEVLRTVDECIRLTDAVIERAEELKRGLMQRLLTRGIGHKEYMETPLGKIPKTWKIKRMKELTLDHKQGYYTKEKYVENGVRLIRITDLMNPKISWNTMPRLDVDKKTYEQFKVEKGDFLFARSGAIGRYGIVEGSEKGIFGSYIIRFKFNPEKLNNNYFGYVYGTQKIQNQIQRYKHGSTNININAEDIKFLMIALPEIKEQKEIVQILSDIDKKIFTEMEKKKNLNLIKKGLMQLLLSGKTRVELKGDELHRIRNGREANN